jgi:4-alpha-glucanotransferase
VKWGIFRLISDVIFLENPWAKGHAYYPRHSLHQTYSYRELDGGMQWRLNELYIDYFYKRHENYWREQAMVRLPAVRNATNMLICGEDLGMVPACVPEVMQDLGFLSLDIQRMPKAMGVEFSRPVAAPYLSVVTPSTHDMSTIRGWWEEDRELITKFCNHELGLTGEAPQTATPEIVEAVVRQHLASPAMWSIFQLQDLLGMDGRIRRADVEAERINVPAIPNFYWRYRLHLNLEKLSRGDGFNSHLKQMLAAAGR